MECNPQDSCLGRKWRLLRRRRSKWKSIFSGSRNSNGRGKSAQMARYHPSHPRGSFEAYIFKFPKLINPIKIMINAFQYARFRSQFSKRMYQRSALLRNIFKRLTVWSTKTRTKELLSCTNTPFFLMRFKFTDESAQICHYARAQLPWDLAN